MTSAALNPSMKPRLRGVSHQWAAAGAVIAGGALVALSPSAGARVACGVYALAIVGLFAVSAVYHRVNWSTVAARQRMRRLDHSMIFVMIAGTVTPMAALALDGSWRTVVLVGTWSLAGAGIIMKLLWIGAPRWVSSAVYVGVGAAGLCMLPGLVAQVGVWPAAVVLAGGVLYAAGAVIYALRRPDPLPRVFGYHEIFHVLVIAAAIAHYLVVALAVLPAAG